MRRPSGRDADASSAASLGCTGGIVSRDRSPAVTGYPPGRSGLAGRTSRKGPLVRDSRGPLRRPGSRLSLHPDRSALFSGNLELPSQCLPKARANAVMSQPAPSAALCDTRPGRRCTSSGRSAPRSPAMGWRTQLRAHRLGAGDRKWRGLRPAAVHACSLCPSSITAPARAGCNAPDNRGAHPPIPPRNDCDRRRDGRSCRMHPCRATDQRTAECDRQSDAQGYRHLRRRYSARNG